MRLSAPDLSSRPEKIRTSDIYGKLLDEFARRPEEDENAAAPLVFQLIVGYFYAEEARI